jgi:phenylacetate-coenzyme A ligase PaaK-like adenylate-forming protein
MRQGLRDRVFNIKDEKDFWQTAHEVRDYQFSNNIVYHQFIKGLGRDTNNINNHSDIRFLPVEFFRNHKIITGNRPVEMIFESSGTTGSLPGKHLVSDLKLYEESFTKSFRHFYGNPEDYLICALLPSYTERRGSSLVYMAERLVKLSLHPYSGFYKDNTEELLRIIHEAKAGNHKILLLGVSFALLDLAEKSAPDLTYERTTERDAS